MIITAHTLRQSRPSLQTGHIGGLILTMISTLQRLGELKTSVARPPSPTAELVSERPSLRLIGSPSVGIQTSRVDRKKSPGHLLWLDQNTISSSKA